MFCSFTTRRRKGVVCLIPLQKENVKGVTCFVLLQKEGVKDVTCFGLSQKEGMNGVTCFVLLQKEGMKGVTCFLVLQKEGVKVFVILYKELEIALTINSHYSKHALMNKHENIKVRKFVIFWNAFLILSPVQVI